MPRNNRDLLIVLLIAAIMFCLRSWESDLHGDPVLYASVAKTMVATGNWIDLQSQPGVMYANKPPLMIWLAAVNFSIFGANTYTAGFWSRVFAVAGCVLLYLLARRLLGERTAFLAGIALATMPGLIRNGTDLRLDSAVTFYAILTVYAVVRAVQDERPRWLLLIGVAAGLGLMTKAVAGVHVAVLTLAALALYRPRWLLHPCLAGALLVAAAIALPWHLAAYLRLGSAFVSTYFGREMGDSLELSAYYFPHVLRNIGILLVGGLPWWPFGAFAVSRWRRATAVERRAMFLALLWVGEVVLLMAIPEKRYDRYTITAYPALALLSAWGVNRVLPEHWREALPRFAARLFVVAALALALVPWPIHSYGCREFTDARLMIDHLEPAATVASFDPKEPAGAGRHENQYALRAKAVYYWDRGVINYHTVDALRRDRRQLVVVLAPFVPTLAAAGYREVLPLSNKRTIMVAAAPSN